MKKAVMLYDGLCILCTQSHRIILILDWLGHIEHIDAQDRDAVISRFPDLADQDILGQIFVQTRTGNWETGFFGMRDLARHLPGAWLLLPFLYLPGMNTVGPLIYTWSARRRYAINKMFGQDCPDGACKLRHDS